MHRRRRNPARVLGRVLSTLTLIAAVGALLGLGVGPRLLHYRTLTMLTGSMRPGFPPGSVLIDRRLPTAALRPGDVLTYHIPVDAHEVVSHRVLAIRAGQGGWVVHTKGDANNGPDPWTAVITTPTVWTARADVPYAGFVIAALRRPGLHQLLLIAVPALLAGAMLLGIWRKPRRAVPA